MRVIVEIKWSVDISQFMADTRMLGSTGKRLPASRSRTDYYCGLGSSEFPEMRRMMYKMAYNAFKPTKIVISGAI